MYGLPSFGRALIADVTVPYSQGPGVLETTYAVDAVVEEQAAALDDTLAGDEAINDADSVEKLDNELETVDGATDEDNKMLDIMDGEVEVDVLDGSYKLVKPELAVIDTEIMGRIAFESLIDATISPWIQESELLPYGAGALPKTFSIVN
jgi:hypothetical protein